MGTRGVILLLLFCSVQYSCTKGPGYGGRATIKGKVFARNYSASNILIDSGYIGNEKVFINYGNEIGVGDDIDTDFKGEFIFPYLRKGTYTIYVYTKIDKNQIDSAISKVITIDERKQIIELPDFEIKTYKN